MTIQRLLILSAVPLVFGSFAFAGNAAANELLIAQNSSPTNGQRQAWKGRGHGRIFSQLNLTDAQRTQIEQIHASARQQMEAVFTPTQREQMQAARAQRQRPNLNMTEAQRAQMRTIHENSKAQIEAVLTEQQRQQLQESRSSRGEGRYQRQR